ncbi:Integrin beta-5, partial [Galemys pyrenaicus]
MSGPHYTSRGIPPTQDMAHGDGLVPSDAPGQACGAARKALHHQTSVPQEKIGWRKDALHLLVFTTDDVPHIALDGKLGGLVQPHDGQCHLNEANEYTASNQMDYPSLALLGEKLAENNINLIFAVTKNHYVLYKNFTALIPGTTVEILHGDSKNIIQLIINAYSSIRSKVELSVWDQPEDLNLFFTATCQDGVSYPGQRKCEGLKTGDTVSSRPCLWCLSALVVILWLLIRASNVTKLVCILASSSGLSCPCPCPCVVSLRARCICSGAPVPLHRGPCESHSRAGPLDEWEANADTPRLWLTMSTLFPLPSAQASFEVLVEARSCPGKPTEHTFTLRPVGFRDSLEVGVTYNCKCSCSADPELDSARCSGNGTYVCGLCECNPSHLGSRCECQEGENQSLYQNLCREAEGKPLCSGRGECSCNQCSCFESEFGKIYGTFCECDNFSCARNKGVLC